MEQSCKLYETGTIPYNVTTDVSVKDFSDQQNTNIENGLLFILSKFDIIQDNYTTEEPVIINDYIE